MSHSFVKAITLISLLFLASLKSQAQLFDPQTNVVTTRSNSENAPYSRFGLGEWASGINEQIKGMGSISSAYSNPYSINSDNPASYASLKLTTYEAGAQFSIRNVITTGSSYATGSATLSHINIGIPLGKYAGMCFGLKPVTHVYYRLQDTSSIDSLGQVRHLYSGEGGLNYAFIGFAGKIKGFSLGFNFGYIFGTNRNSSELINLNDTSSLVNSGFTTSTKIGGVNYKLGASYETNLNKKLMLRIGATASLSQKLTANRDNYWLSYRNSGGTYQIDTIKADSFSKGTYKLPFIYSAGFIIGDGLHWSAGLDYTATQWSQYTNYGIPDSLQNSMRIGIGGEYTPDPLSVYKYFQRVTYRLGFYYGTDEVKLRNTNLNYYAVTVGASLPFKRSQDRINAAMEIGSRGTTANGLVRENFVKFSLGISLNDRWFVKRKYE